MINAYRQALKEISAETKEGTRRATPAATANQEAFRKFVREQSNEFRKAGLAHREAWSKACSAWSDVKVPAQESGPDGFQESGPDSLAHDRGLVGSGRGQH